MEQTTGKNTLGVSTRESRCTLSGHGLSRGSGTLELLNKQPVSRQGGCGHMRGCKHSNACTTQQSHIHICWQSDSCKTVELCKVGWIVARATSQCRSSGVGCVA